MAKAKSKINLEEAGPDIDLKGNGPWTIWAWINAADDHGIQISGVEVGDDLQIELISGIGYFAGASGWWRALSIAVEAGKTVINPTSNLASKIAAKGLEGVNKVVPKDEKASKPRDGYGEKLDGDGTAQEEGGNRDLPTDHRGAEVRSRTAQGWRNRTAWLLLSDARQ